MEALVYFSVFPRLTNSSFTMNCDNITKCWTLSRVTVERLLKFLKNYWSPVEIPLNYEADF